MFNQKQVTSKIESYLLGFLYADGYITGKRKDKYYILGINLKEEDQIFLQKIVDVFNEALATNYSLKYQKNTKSYRVSIGNVELVSNLQKLGIIPNKTYDQSSFIFDNVPNEYKKDFILGLFDGDGYFFTGNQNKNYCGVISLNKNLLSTICNFINSELGENFALLKEPTSGDPYPRIRFSQNKARIFGRWLYSNCVDICLERKRNNYLDFLPVQTKAHLGWKNSSTKGIFCKETQKVYITAKEAAKEELNTDNPGAVNSIRMVCRQERNQTRGKHFRYLTEQEKENYIKYGCL